MGMRGGKKRNCLPIGMSDREVGTSACYRSDLLRIVVLSYIFEKKNEGKGKGREREKDKTRYLRDYPMITSG